MISVISMQSGVLRKGDQTCIFRLDASPTFICLGDKIVSCHSRKKYEVTDVGILHPEEVSTSVLFPGQVGYVSCNMKESSEGLNASSPILSSLMLVLAHIGDTFHLAGQPVEPMPGFQQAKAMV